MPKVDEKSTAGKQLPVREHAQVLVVGAGPAGIAAALEAVGQGLQVVLVDEHPVDYPTMGMDVPFHFGQRMSGAVRNKGRMLERMVQANAQISEAFEAGVDIRLGSAAWGLFVNRPGLRWVHERLVGLADGDETWFMSFDVAILATGRRDIGLAFPGWELPGVMGVTAADALLRRYDAFSGHDILVVGSGVEATVFAEQALQKGCRVVALIEVAEKPVDRTGCQRLGSMGVSVLTKSMVSRATGGAEGVRSAAIVSLAGASETRTFDCDTIVLACGVAPVIELFDVAGARTVFCAERGGHIPATDPNGRTSVPMLFAAGDCAGITAEMSKDPQIAAAQGRQVARAASAALKAGAQWDWSIAKDDEPDGSVFEARIEWAKAELEVADEGTFVCQCEEVSAADMIGVRPPRYLRGVSSVRQGRGLATLLADGPINQDQIKRLTRAGMGVCQGRRCREQVGSILSVITDTPLGQIPLPSYRAPVRPLPLSAFAASDEGSDLADNWEVWFGIKSQFDE